MEDKKKNVGGRPPKINPELVDKICNLLRAGNYIETACAACGIASTTFRGWMRDGARDIAAGRKTVHSAFVETVTQAQAASEAVLVAGVAKAAQEDWKAAAWLLSKKAPTRFGDKTEVMLKGDAESPVHVAWTLPVNPRVPQLAPPSTDPLLEEE